ncbi:MAG: hypothetical protein ACOYVF_06085 [Candidatus Zixiibacteriota bacterium]
MIEILEKIEKRNKRLDFNDELTTVKMNGSDIRDKAFIFDRRDIDVLEPEISDDDLGKIIIAAFSSNDDWRTVGGISRATGLSYSAVKTFLDNHETLFEKTPFKIRGRTLYSLRSRR